MDDVLQRYLDGITFLASLVVGELVALSSTTPSEADPLAGLGFGMILFVTVVAYQRRVFDSEDGDGSASNRGESPGEG